MSEKADLLNIVGDNINVCSFQEDKPEDLETFCEGDTCGDGSLVDDRIKDKNR